MASENGFQLASAAVDGRSRVVVRDGAGGALHLLDDLLGAQAPAAESVSELFGDWAGLTGQVRAALAAGTGAPALAEGDLRWLAPLRYPRKFVCIGANYQAHNKEMEVDRPRRPAFPYSFMVPAATGIVATGARVRVPQHARKLDWEGEVAIVIGRRAHRVTGAEATAAIGAYAVLNDLSARDWALPNAPPVGIDWVMSKAYDGFKPMGPWVTPADQVEDPQAIRIQTWVNGVVKQDGTTADMMFSFTEIVEHLAAIMTLEPGDLIATGTPAGVGHGRRPQEYLVSGDTVAVEISGLGRVETTLVD